MIRHPRLTEVIRPDLILPPHPRPLIHPTQPHRLPPQTYQLRLPLFAPHLRDLRPQQVPRLFAVRVLATRVLHRDDGPRRDVRESDGGVGLVDVLAAGAFGAHGLGADSGGVDIEVALRVVEVGGFGGRGCGGEGW